MLDANVRSKDAGAMYPIQLRVPGSSRGIDPNDLVSVILDLCEQHRREHRALAFAFIFYDQTHAQVVRVLEEPHFYDAFHAISGKSITVFFVDSRQQAEPGSHRHDPDIELRRESLQTIQETFGVEWDSSKPAILFFQVDPIEKSYQGRLVSFRDEGYDSTFGAMKTLLALAAKSIERVQPENASNYREIFQLIDNALESHSFKRGIGFVYKAVVPVRGVFS